MSSHRHRGGGGGGGRGAWEYEFSGEFTPHEDFPEIALPEMTCVRMTNEEKALMMSSMKLDGFLRNSCYHLQEDAPKRKNEDKEIERFSDRKRKTQTKREALASYLILTTANFPAELIQGSRRGQLSNKKRRWDRDSDGKAFEALEKLEENHKDGDKKEAKDGDDDDEREEEEAEEDGNSEDDYNQNIEFDDDDDDWNQEEAHEDYYE